MKVALFNNKWDNAVDKITDRPWDEWATNFVNHYTQHGAPEVDDKNELVGAVFGEWDRSERARLRPDGKLQRVQDNFLAFHCLTLDIEQRPGHPEVRYAEVRSALEGIEHVGFTTFSHLQPGKGERYRIILPLLTPLPTSTLERLARPTGAQEVWEGSLPALFPFCDHKATWKRLQIAYLPGTPTPDLFVVWREHGELFDWTALELLPERVSLPVRQAKTSPDNTGAPVLHTMDLYRLFSDAGWIRRGNVGDRTVQVTCPNHAEHTNGLNDGAALLFEPETGRYGFYCQHSHCSHLAGHRLKEWFKENLEEWADYCERLPQFDLESELKAFRSKRSAALAK